MTTLTVNLDDSLVKRTLELAEARHATVDDIVADALKEVSLRWNRRPDDIEGGEDRRLQMEAAMLKFSNFDTGGPYSRDEMNER